MKFKNYIIILFLCVLGSVSLAQNNTNLYVYDLGMENMSIENRIAFIKSIGYSGSTIRIKSPVHLKLLEQYKTLSSNTDGFDLEAVYVPYSFDDDANIQNVWKQVVQKLEGSNTKLWMIFWGNPNRETALKTLQEMHKTCIDKNVQLVFYPHDGSYIETIEESVELYKEAGIADISTSLHLCHEFRAGNKDRIVELAHTFAPYIKLVSISGAENLETYPGGNGWNDLIKPLNKGDYDVQIFINALKAIDYKGITFLHTFGIKTNPKTHLSESFQAWETLNW